VSSSYENFMYPRHLSIAQGNTQYYAFLPQNITICHIDRVQRMIYELYKHHYFKR